MNQHDSDRKKHGNLIMGLTLIAAGSLFLLDRLNYLYIQDYWFLIPAIVALNGLIDIVTATQAKHTAEGASTIVIAIWLYVSIERVYGLNFYNSWPMLIIAWGLRYLLEGLLSKNNTQGE